MTPAEKMTKIAENIPKIYQAGTKAAYDTFWDSYQENGNRTHYACAFAGRGWNEHLFKPKYNIAPTTAYMMFYHSNPNANIDLVKTAEECGITFDFSACTDFTYFVYNPCVTRLGVIDTRAAKGFTQFAGSNSKLHTIEKLILNDDGSQTISNAAWFLPSSLVNITFEGKLGASVRCVASKMTKASLTSFLKALSDTSTGQTLTLSKAAVGREFQTAEGANNGITSDEWNALVNAKPNWTISLL